MPVAASKVVVRAPARVMTRGSPNRRAGVLRPSAVRDGCAIRSKAGLARTVPWPARSVSSMRRLTARARGLQFGEVGQAGVAARVARGGDAGLDPHGAAVFGGLLEGGI